MRKLHVAVELKDPVSPDPNRRLVIVLAERYGDDALLAHGWINDQLWTHGFVELLDDGGRPWSLTLARVQLFVVRARLGELDR